MMASNNNESTSPAGSPTDHDEDYNAGAVNPQDQLLLEALRQFIVPHIGAAVAQAGSNQNLRGPEAMKLVMALKEFISSVVRGSESKAETAMEVSMKEELRESELAEDIDNADDAQELKASTLPNIFGIGRDVFYDYSRTCPNFSLKYCRNIFAYPWLTKDLPEPYVARARSTPQSPFHSKLLQALQEHVFNKMPIRLLCSVQRRSGDNLQISLIDRETIFKYLASKIEANMHDADHCPKFRKHFRRRETDEEAISRLIPKYVGYAILSHTWLRSSPGEVTYSDWNEQLFKTTDPGYQKLYNFCKVALTEYGVALTWMDTICINKDSSSELDESIRSMYNWYQRAKVCIIHLSETRVLSDMPKDKWFTRGWTLQELFAPNCIKFYTRDWSRLAQHATNDKEDDSIAQHIERATKITKQELQDIRGAPVSRRMELAAARRVTREEDTAYSLMGIFNISIAIAYGEGAERAFSRLLQEILNSTSRGILDIFNWAGGHRHSSASQILPSSPTAFLRRTSSVNLHHILPFEPLTLTHVGLRVPVLLMPAILAGGVGPRYETIGAYGAIVSIPPEGTTYYLLSSRLKTGSPQLRPKPYTFAVFNIERRGVRDIFIPQICIAILLKCDEEGGQVTSMGSFNRTVTMKPIVFELTKIVPSESRIDNYTQRMHSGITLSPDELASHGMQLISKYL